MFACITRANAFLIRKDVLPLFATILPKISATRTGKFFCGYLLTTWNLTTMKRT